MTPEIYPKPIYLGGPMEAVDTWRGDSAERLYQAGLIPVIPGGEEKLKLVSKGDIQSNFSDEEIVENCYSQLNFCKKYNGIVVVNLEVSKEGRPPGAVLMEIEWAYQNNVPIYAVINDKTPVNIRNNPWIRHHVTKQFESIQNLVDFIIDQYGN